MIRKLLKLTGFLVLVIFIIGTLAFTSIESKNIMCADIQVIFNKRDVINIEKDKLIRLVKSVDNKVLSKTLGEINANIIEEEIEKLPAILKADVYKLMVNENGAYKGTLVVKVKHREPVLRVIASSGSYYLDEFGMKIPVSTNYATNVMVASGSISEGFAVEQLLPFVLYIEDNDFWKAQIQQIYVEEDGDVLLSPLVGDHIIELGDLNNYRWKLHIMSAFYKQVLAKNNWDKYEMVSLKYNNQVVAKRK
jgi:cell division protein FtsQ